MADCETNGHVYREMSTKCIFCGYEPTDWAKCSPVCAYYPTGACRCAQFENPPASSLGERDE